MLINNFVVPPRSQDEIERATQMFRNSAGQADGPLDMAQILELSDAFGFETSIDEESADRGYEAYYDPSEGKVLHLPESVYEDACNGLPRARFTIAHELGHFALGHCATLARVKDQTIPAYMTSEWQANAFAAALLMPRQAIYKHQLFSPDSLAQYFNVSLEAAKVRLKKLGFLYKNPNRDASSIGT